MILRLFNALVVACTLLGAPLALGASGQTFGFDLGLLYSQSSQDDGTTTQEIATTGIHFKASIFIMDGLAIGLVHHQIDNATSFKSSVNGFTFTQTQTDSKTGEGLFVGYYANSGFNIGISLLFNPTRTNPAIKFSGGSAYVFNIGQLFEINKMWSAGFSFIYSQFAFTKSEADGVEMDLSDNLKETQLLPMGNFCLTL